MKKIIALAVSLALALCLVPVMPASAGSSRLNNYTVIDPPSSGGSIPYTQGDIITFRGSVGGGMESSGAAMCGLSETTNDFRDMYSTSIGTLYTYKLLYEGRINYSNGVITMTLDSTNIPPGTYRFFFIHTWTQRVYGSPIGNVRSVGMYQDITIYAPGTNPYTAPSPTPTPTPEETLSSWAIEPVTEAIALGFVPPNLRSRYNQAISRSDFCALAVAVYEIVKDVVITGRVSFNDAPGNINIEKMAYVGVINGVGDGNVAPNSPLTREQAATMLARLAEAIGTSLPDQAAAFTDNSSISPWAIEGVGKMQAAGIMTGVDGGRFAPAEPYTLEQSITTMLRLFNAIPPSVRLPNLPLEPMGTPIRNVGGYDYTITGTSTRFSTAADGSRPVQAGQIVYAIRFRTNAELFDETYSLYDDARLINRDGHRYRPRTASFLDGNYEIGFVIPASTDLTGFTFLRDDQWRMLDTPS